VAEENNNDVLLVQFISNEVPCTEDDNAEGYGQPAKYQVKAT
jgi:hypothetical protein